MSEVIYSDHCKKRMMRRGIEEWEIEHVVKYPEYIKKSIDGRKVVVGEAKDRKIKIVFIEEQNYKKVVSVMFL
ncbi:DUF4258 domain-containing protein [Candidatus Pacearchaeota archaeon]|nr:DUF4258 domain-containing protein [Candidatus Pacearchaeota archaeon]